MDLNTVTSYRRAVSRDDLRLTAGEAFLAGGTSLFSEPQPMTTGVVDLMSLGWPGLEVTADGLRIGATCTIARLVAFARGRDGVRPPGPWRALEIVPEAADALLASFKVWNAATVGGNVCCSFPAGAMTALAVGLDGVAEVWTVDGGSRRVAVAELVTGNGANGLGPGEVLRAVDLPGSALRSRALFRRIALTELGRSGAALTGRVDADGTVVFGVTAATERPVVLRFDGMPDAAALAAAVGSAAGYYTDPLGAADWRRGVSIVLAEGIRTALEAEA